MEAATYAISILAWTWPIWAVLGWFLLIVSCWKPYLRKTYLTYYTVFLLQKFCAAQDYGKQIDYILMQDAWVGVAMFSYGYIKTDIATHAVVFAYHTLFMMPTLYMVGEDSISYNNLMVRFVVMMFNVALNMVMIQIVYGMMGYLYLDAKLLQQSYMRLLNSMKEGIFIFDESSNQLEFTNEFAQRLKAELGGQSSISLSQDSRAGQPSKFTKVMVEQIKKQDLNCALKMLLERGDYLEQDLSSIAKE